MTKQQIIKKIINHTGSKHRNSMGCSESWYYPEWAIKQTFSRKELEAMTIKEIKNLLKLANNISDGLY